MNLNLTGFAPLVFLLLLIGGSARPLHPLPSEGDNGSRKPLQTFRPYNIAHRGSNGEIPEETRPAYMVNLHNSFGKIAFLSHYFMHWKLTENICIKNCVKSLCKMPRVTVMHMYLYPLTIHTLISWAPCFFLISVLDSIFQRFSYHVDSCFINCNHATIMHKLVFGTMQIT